MKINWHIDDDDDEHFNMHAHLKNGITFIVTGQWTKGYWWCYSFTILHSEQTIHFATVGNKFKQSETRLNKLFIKELMQLNLTKDIVTNKIIQYYLKGIE